MILLTHPTGNVFVRALLKGLCSQNQLDSFYTTLDTRALSALGRLLGRASARVFPVLPEKIHALPTREIVRLIAPRIGLGSLCNHESGWASLDQVIRELDCRVAHELFKRSRHGGSLPAAVYSYEDCCLSQFQAAQQLGLKRFYELPIAYWETSRRLLTEEAQRLPQWEPTLVGTSDSAKKLERKSEELALANAVICPSEFVLNSLPPDIRRSIPCLVAEFGTPEVDERVFASRRLNRDDKLRVLFAGSLSQRKGLGDLFAAMKLLNRSDVELVVMGMPVVDMSFYRRQFAPFTYEAPRPHTGVLRLMSSCDVLVMPSIVEGRALVQQEAMACGLPVIATANAGASDIVVNGTSGFLVDIRAPEQIAAKIAWFADNRQTIAEMGRRAREQALTLTWDTYCRKIFEVIL